MASVVGAVDIGGTKIGVALTSEDGVVLWRDAALTAEMRDGATGVGFVAAALQAGLRSTGGELAGVGVGCTGPVDWRSGVVGAVELLPGWEGYPLAEALAERLGTPVAVDNDANAGALAEWRWGAGQGAERLIYVTVGTGLGVGMVFGGALYRGARGVHPEVGHHVIDTSGPLCYCGARGCWESLASGTALAAWARTQASPPELPAGLSTAQLFDLARAGHPFGLAAAARVSRLLGLGLANLVTLYGPDVVVFGGGVMTAHDLILPGAIEAGAMQGGLVPIDHVAVRPAAAGDRAALLGAAEVWRNRFARTARHEEAQRCRA